MIPAARRWCNFYTPQHHHKGASSSENVPDTLNPLLSVHRQLALFVQHAPHRLALFVQPAPTSEGDRWNGGILGYLDRRVAADRLASFGATAPPPIGFVCTVGSGHDAEPARPLAATEISSRQDAKGAKEEHRRPERRRGTAGPAVLGVLCVLARDITLAVIETCIMPVARPPWSFVAGISRPARRGLALFVRHGPRRLGLFVQPASRERRRPMQYWKQGYLDRRAAIGRFGFVWRGSSPTDWVCLHSRPPRIGFVWWTHPRRWSSLTIRGKLALFARHAPHRLALFVQQGGIGKLR